MTTGSQNTAMDTWAGRRITSGIENTTVGTFALLNDSPGSQNTAIGKNTLAGLLSGNPNVAMGYYAGRWISGGSTPNTISNSSIFIGDNTRPLGNNQTNQMVVGAALTGLGSNTAIYGNSSITYSHIAGNLLTGPPPTWPMRS